MTSHLTEEEMVALLQGTLARDARDQAKRHLGSCAACTDALAREASLDAVLWRARHAAVARAGAAAPPDPGVRTPRAPRSGHARSWIGAAIAVGVATAVGDASSTSSASMVSKASAASDLLGWQNIAFFIPLVAGLLLIVGSVFGAHGHGTGHDLGHAAGHGPHAGAGHEGHGSLFARAFAVLGVGRVPLSIVLMVASLYFGGLGIILNTLLSAAGLAPSFYGPISLAGAFVGMVALSGATARLIHRHLPAMESYPISRHDFAGCSGTLLLPADTCSGYAQIKDREGNVHNIRCYSMRGAVPKGTAVLVVEYDEDSQTFVIDVNHEPTLH
jgi:hypothetical protein